MFEVALTPIVADVEGQLVGPRMELKSKLRAVRPVGRLPVGKKMLRPMVGVVRSVTAAMPSTAPRLFSSARPATSEALGAMMSQRLTGVASVAVAVPVASSQPVAGVAEFRHAPELSPR